MSAKNPDAAKLLRKIRSDFPWFCERFIRVQDQSGEEVPLRLKPAQLEFVRLIERLSARGGRVKIIILKARQLGFTTVIQAWLLWRACFFKGKSAIVVAHLEEVAGKLFENKIEFMYEHLPAELRPTKKKGRTGKTLALNAPQDSFLWVEHEANVDAGRSFTFQGAHLSEFAFYKKNPKKLLTSLMRAVHDVDGNAAFIESTADGMGNEFHNIWKGAELGEGHKDWNGWHAHFVAWHEEPSYRREARPSDPPLSGEEREVQKRFALSLEQMLWRRDQISEMGLEDFMVEYPAEAKEAFAMSGRPYILPRILEKHARLVRPPMRWVEYEQRGKVGVPVDQEPHGRLWIWQNPVEGFRYVVSADPASGDAIDNSAAHVLKIGARGYEMVASFAGKIDPDEFGLLLARIGFAYRERPSGVAALLAPEANSGYGQAVIRRLRNLPGGLEYPNLYRDQRYDAAISTVDVRFGWHTAKNRRDAALERMKEALREGEVSVPCSRTMGELETLAYVELPAGGEKVMAPKGARDDLVMSFSIAVSVADTAPVLSSKANDVPVFEAVVSEALGY